MPLANHFYRRPIPSALRSVLGFAGQNCPPHSISLSTPPNLVSTTSPSSNTSPSCSPPIASDLSALRSVLGFAGQNCPPHSISLSTPPNLVSTTSPSSNTSPSCSPPIASIADQYRAQWARFLVLQGKTHPRLDLAIHTSQPRKYHLPLV